MSDVKRFYTTSEHISLQLLAGLGANEPINKLGVHGYKICLKQENQRKLSDLLALFALIHYRYLTKKYQCHVFFLIDLTSFIMNVGEMLVSQRKRCQHIGQHVGEMLAPFVQAFTNGAQSSC